MTLLNGNDVAALREQVESFERDPAKAERRPVVTATWTGGDRSRVTSKDTSIDVSGPGTLGPMELVLAALAGCEIDVIATHATLMGIEIEDLTIEVKGEFNVRSYLASQGSPPASRRSSTPRRSAHLRSRTSSSRGFPSLCGKRRRSVRA